MEKPLKAMSHIGGGIIETEDIRTNQSVAGGLWVLEKCEATEEDWIKLIDERLLPEHPRMRSIMRDNKWEDQGPEWSSKAVVKALQMEQSDDWRDVESFISSLHSTRMSYGLPLWRLYVIAGYQDKQLCFWRFHHALSDGVSFSAIVVRALAQDFPRVKRVRASLWAKAAMGLWIVCTVVLVLLRWALMLLRYPRHPSAWSNGLCGKKRVCPPLLLTSHIYVLLFS